MRVQVLRMYNQLLGTVRLTQQRVRSDSCSGSPTLINQPSDCYAAFMPANLATKPFGPWYDQAKYTSTTHFGKPEYTIDLGSNPELASSRLHDLRETGFLGLPLRHFSINMLFYNNALDIFCSVRIVFLIPRAPS